MAEHIPVLLEDSLRLLLNKEDGIYADLTTGEGGHSFEIARRLKDNGKLICFDRDKEIQSIAKENLKEFSNISFVLKSFSHLKEALNELKLPKIDGILADLGLSMYHYRESSKGFSFLRDDPLDMSLDNASPNAYDVINSFPKDDIADILYEYGEERASRRIASFIFNYRKQKKIESTKELADIIRKAVPFRGKKGFHPATKSFQALRIYVNQELENLKTLLNDSLECLNPGGRLVIISYHSLEDRIVKHFFREKAQQKQIKLLHKKPIIATNDEVKLNASARSAKMRAIEIL